MKEIWKDVPGTEGQYSVSDQGNVRSNWRRHYNAFIDEHYVVHRERIMKPSKNTRSKLLVVNLRRLGPVVVRRLVAEAFIPNVEGAMFVRNIDGDWTNNAASNLEWTNTCPERGVIKQHNVRDFEAAPGEQWASLYRGYTFSNYGRVRRLVDNKLMTPRCNGQVRIIDKGVVHYFKIPRLISETWGQ